MGGGEKRVCAARQYSPQNRMSVKFTDDAGISEGAVDEGGPRHEFLQLLISHLAEESPLFIGPSQAKNLNCLSAGAYVLANLSPLYRDRIMLVNTGH